MRQQLPRSQCTFWCSVLSDTSKQVCGLWPFAAGLNAPSGAQYFPTLNELIDPDFTVMSQCTFWCSVLSDGRTPNAPRRRSYLVSMHLLVLSAFRRREAVEKDTKVALSQCTFWCSVLSDTLYAGDSQFPVFRSQCTFWCSVLSDTTGTTIGGNLMGLNAPSGAQCFPTCGRATSWPWPFGLNAPSGAQCFPTRRSVTSSLSRPDTSQCTFWCSVLSDSTADPYTPSRTSCLNAPSGAQCFPT